VPTLLERDGLLAAWRGLTANLTGDLCDGYELDERGRVVRNQPPSGRRQIAATDIYCQVTEQLGRLAGMSVASQRLFLASGSRTSSGCRQGPARALTTVNASGGARPLCRGFTRQPCYA
jgi:hypothetical protein